MSTPVADSTGYGPNREMSVLGYVVAALIAVLLLPLLPFAVVGWVLWRLLRSDEEGEATPRSWPTNRSRRRA